MTTYLTDFDEKTARALALLCDLIQIPSFSKEENGTATQIEKHWTSLNIPHEREGNNIWVKNLHFDSKLPTILLNSHHDTVKPAKSWTFPPFEPTRMDDVIYGLGSNDAGAPLVALMEAFYHFYTAHQLPFNLIMAATAEEEISGAGGIASILPRLGNLALGIIGEPTQMQMAVAERGLMVIDGYAHGKAGHAARSEGINAIYLALKDIEAIRTFEFAKKSVLLGSTQAAVTQIEGGTQHNVVPDVCHFVIDVRTNEHYTHEEVHALLQNIAVHSTLQPRSCRLRSSHIPLDHPVVQRGMALGLSHFGSPTLSDQALLHHFPTIKIGCGDSARSHTGDEFIRISEIADGIKTYIQLLDGLCI